MPHAPCKIETSRFPGQVLKVKELLLSLLRILPQYSHRRHIPAVYSS